MCLLSLHTNQTVVSVRYHCIVMGQVATDHGCRIDDSVSLGLWGQWSSGASTKREANASLSAGPLSCWVCKAAGQMEWRRSRGPGPIKTQARVSSPTLIILDLSHLSTVCKYINTAWHSAKKLHPGDSSVNWGGARQPPACCSIRTDLLRLKTRKLIFTWLQLPFIFWESKTYSAVPCSFRFAEILS